MGNVRMQLFDLVALSPKATPYSFKVFLASSWPLHYSLPPLIAFGREDWESIYKEECDLSEDDITGMAIPKRSQTIARAVIALRIEK